jgi:hypothetical protein
MAGTNYFLDPRFALIDDDNQRVYVTAWAPLELSPSPPQGAQRAAGTLNIMQDYLGRRLSVTGTFRADVDRAMPFVAPGAIYFEVESVTDIDTGTRVFHARMTEGSDTTAAGTADATSGAKPALKSVVPQGPEEEAAHLSAPQQTSRAQAAPEVKSNKVPRPTLRAEVAPETEPDRASRPTSRAQAAPEVKLDKAPRPTLRAQVAPGKESDKSPRPTSRAQAAPAVLSGNSSHAVEGERATQSAQRRTGPQPTKRAKAESPLASPDKDTQPSEYPKE